MRQKMSTRSDPGAYGVSACMKAEGTVHPKRREAMTGQGRGWAVGRKGCCLLLDRIAQTRVSHRVHVALTLYVDHLDERDSTIDVRTAAYYVLTPNSSGDTRATSYEVEGTYTEILS